MRDTCGQAVLDGVRTRCGRGGRALDLALTLLILPLALVLGILVAVAVMLDSQGPVLFRSARVGRDGRLFRMLKFRTMRHGVGGARVSSQGDCRYTPVGRLLAASRLDEVPQLWNVLRGQMRLVGPRPEVEEFVLDRADSYRRILSVPPGITGPTQLAFADEGRLLAAADDPVGFYRRELLPAKVRSDLRYVEAGSRRKDTALLLRTCAIPFTQLEGSLTAPSRRSGRRVFTALARAGALAGAVFAMLGLFVVQGASAQAPEAPATDPEATTPAGSVYALPLDAARRDAAPRGDGQTGGRGSRRGRDSGGRALPARRSPIRSENNFGSSSRVPGIEGPAFRRGAHTSGLRGFGADGAGTGARSAPIGRSDPRVEQTAVAARLGSEAEDDPGSPSLLAPLLLTLVVGLGATAGVLAGRVRRR